MGVGSTEPSKSEAPALPSAGAKMSEVIPEDEDRGGAGALEPDAEPRDDDEQGGTGPDDGGPGSQNM